MTKYTYVRLENEQDDELIYRVCKDKELIGSWEDVKDILNDLLGYDYGESTYRKKYAAFCKMFEANRSKFVDSDSQVKALRDEQRRLEIEKIKFRDERNAWAQQNRIQARAEAKLDNIEQALMNFGRINFPEHKRSDSKNVDRAMIIMLNDLHIGQTFDNFFGKYNTEIAERRMAQLLDEVKEIAQRHGCGSCIVSLGGDNCSGNIHKTIQVTNRKNVIQQIKKAAEMVASFCYELTQIFDYVKLVAVDGNHSRLDKKEEAIHDERLDSLVPYCVNLALGHLDNFQYLDSANIDSGIAMFNVFGNYFLSVHGDYDDFTKNGVNNLITMVGLIPKYILFGHHHTCSVDEANGIVMIRGGSLVGTGDQHTVERRIRGHASQMICVCSENGVEAYYPVRLD